MVVIIGVARCEFPARIRRRNRPNNSLSRPWRRKGKITGNPIECAFRREDDRGRYLEPRIKVGRESGRKGVIRRPGRIADGHGDVFDGRGQATNTELPYNSVAYQSIHVCSECTRPKCDSGCSSRIFRRTA